MERVNNIEEASDWFLENHSGSVLCVKDGKSKEAGCYPDAKEFFSDANCEGGENGM